MNKVEVLENGNVKITIPMSFRNCAGRKRIVTQELNSNFNEPIITNLARAFRWQALIPVCLEIVGSIFQLIRRLQISFSKQFVKNGRVRDNKRRIAHRERRKNISTQHFVSLLFDDL